MQLIENQLVDKMEFPIEVLLGNREKESKNVNHESLRS